MIKLYKSDNDNILQELSLEAIEKGAWINLVKPTSEELCSINDLTSIPLDFLKSALDENEHSRIEIEENYILLIINIPLMLDKNSFDTVPLGIVISYDYIVTVCLKENKIIDNFINDKAKKFSTVKKTRFLFQLLLKSAEFYLRYMRYINHLTDELELELRRSMKNKALFQLFELERSLVYFITALKDNGVVMQKILRLRNNNNFSHLIKVYEEDEELLEDVIIENKQAIEMVEMHSNILTSMMDAFASIISNNLNMVMKFLTSVTIILAIPTMIASFWGMNVDVPWRGHAGGFVFIVILAIIVTGVAITLLWKRKMF